MLHRICSLLALLGLVVLPVTAAWELLSSNAFSAREGLMGVSMGDYIYVTGGRDLFGISFRNDVHRSKDGRTWETVVRKAPWKGRSYHTMLTIDDCLYVMGGQDFTTYFNDIWESCDEGKTWQVIADSAPWIGRAGHASLVVDQSMFVVGGSFGEEKGKRAFLGDVWKSDDLGRSWKLINDTAWLGRSGPRLVEFNNDLFLIAGERGFTDADQLSDVYISRDMGVTWEILTNEPGFSPRSGHGVVVYNDKLYCIAGWPHFHDLYSSLDGITWNLESNSVWNCDSDSCGKFDFWTVVHKGEVYTLGGSGAYSTFGKLFKEVHYHSDH